MKPKFFLALNKINQFHNNYLKKRRKKKGFHTYDVYAALHGNNNSGDPVMQVPLCIILVSNLYIVGASSFND
jgi:hypothetical protein